MSIIGSSLEAVRRDLKYMPTQTLIQYKQNPAKNAVDGIPLDMLAGLELSRRAQMQNELSAAGAQNAANMPTVTDAAAQQLTGQPQQPPAPMPQGAPQPAPPPQQAAPQPQPQVPQQPPMPQMQQAPQGGLPTVNKAAGGQITGRVINDISDLRDLLGGGYAGGGIIAFANRGEVPNAYAGYENVVPESLRSERAETPPEDSVLVDPRAYPAYSAKQKEKKEKKSEAVKADEQKAPPLPPLPPPYIAPPSQLSLTEGLFNLYKNSGGGGGIPAYKPLGIKPPETPDRSVQEAEIRGLANETAEETNARLAQKNFVADLEKRKSPFMTDAEKAAAEDVQFKKYQALYDPVNAETQKVLDERRAALEERRGRRLSEAGLQLGLGMLGGRGNLASIISGAGKEAVGVYQKGQELDDAQQERIQDMHLKQQQALVAQQTGNMDLAHRLAREAQADKLAIDNFAVAKQKEGIAALGEAAKTSGATRNRQMAAEVHLDKTESMLERQRQNISMSIQLAEARNATQYELAALRAANVDLGRQYELEKQLYKIRENERKLALGQIPTIGDKAQANKIVEKYYADPTLPAVAEFVRSREDPDLSNRYARAIKDMQSNVPAISGLASRFLFTVQEAAREQAVQDQLRGTRTSRESSGGVRDYADVAPLFGIGR
jgi:hypothetical protein